MDAIESNIEPIKRLFERLTQDELNEIKDRVKG